MAKWLLSAKENKMTVCLVTGSLRLRIRVRGDACGDFCLVLCFWSWDSQARVKCTAFERLFLCSPHSTSVQIFLPQSPRSLDDRCQGSIPIRRMFFFFLDTIFPNILKYISFLIEQKISRGPYYMLANGQISKPWFFLNFNWSWCAET